MALTREQARRIDRLAEQQLGLPSLVLMENAAINATAAIIDLLDDRLGIGPADARVAVVCGGGNNGGDGYAIARHLHTWGAAVTLYAAKPIDELKGDAATNAAVCRNMRLPIVENPDNRPKVDLVVDALLGTGFHGEVRPPIDRWIRWINERSGPAVVAIDVPSGLDADRGKPADPTIRADLTVTFVDEKAGFASPEAATYLGHVRVAEIGVSPDLVDSVRDAKT